MTTAYIIGETDVLLWGLSSRERLSRQVRAIDGIKVAETLDGVEDDLLLLRADYLYELRTLSGLLQRRGLLMDGPIAAAAAIDAKDAPAARALLAGKPHDRALVQLTAEDLRSFEGCLRMNAMPLLAPIRADAAPALEDRLYGLSYKGITDFVTKWWWPVPAKAVVGFCARRGLSPNSVTLAGFLMMLAACWLFYNDWHLPGLVLAWIMTFLDTVDGKLARVTVQSSRVGHFLDHGMDIIHPPFWYWLWGLSVTPLALAFGLDFNTAIALMLVGYLGGRLIEAGFHALGQVSMFAWRPFDAYFRLFVARRNPCLVLLTSSWLIGAPELGFWLVVAWTFLSFLVMLMRFGIACIVRIGCGPLESWLADPQAMNRFPNAYRTFSSTRRAYNA